MGLAHTAGGIVELAKRRSRRPPRIYYLVSTAGHPNYGDELITRAWLDEIYRMHPEAEVWLDCPYPGRVAHLLADVGHGLRVTSTLWELAHASPSHDPIEDADRIKLSVRELGTPRVDHGLLLLRSVTSVHLLGGGYLNDIWQDNLGILAALAELHEAFGVRVFGTGLGLLPLSPSLQPWVAEQFLHFDSVEVRDQGSAQVTSADVGLDDAFLALASRRQVYDVHPAPDNMVLVQGDLRSWSDEHAFSSIEAFLGSEPDEKVGFVEALPPDDSVYVPQSRSNARFYPFGHIWAEGFPARAGQRWLTTRFHAHLMAAAAGAAGTIIAGRPGYYDHKHASLLALGTGWNVVQAGSGADLTPSLNPNFPSRARTLASRKNWQAERLYRS